MTCCATTRSGSICKIKTKETHCHIHRLKENICSVCLSELKGSCIKLSCNHEFHTQCINEWKIRGNNTCPFCRFEFCDKVPEYKLTLTVENLTSQTNRILTPSSLPEFVRDLISPDARFTEIVIDVDNDEALLGLLEEFGL